MRGQGRAVWFLSLLLALALGTFAFDWLAVPVIAAAFAWVRRGDVSVPLLASLAGAGSWTLLLVVQAGVGPAARVAHVVGQAMQVGAAPLLLLTIAYPALLAGSAAGLVRGFGRGGA